MSPMDTQELAGLAAFGLETMIKELQGKLAVVNAMRAAPVNGHPRRRGRPPKTLMLAAGVSAPVEGKLASGWSTDPEERSREMRRRRAKWGKPKPKAPRERKLHPRDAEHPGHAEWLANQRAGTKKLWARMSVRERKARSANMHAAREHKRPVVKLGATA